MFDSGNDAKKSDCCKTTTELELSVGHYLQKWIFFLNTLLLPQTTFYQASPSAFRVDGKMDCAWVALSHGIVTPFALSFSLSLYSSCPTRMCCPDRTHQACALPLVAQLLFNLEKISLSGWDVWLSVALQKCCSPPCPWVLCWEASQEHMVGVDVAEVEPGVLSVVCHSVRACHLQLKFVVFFPLGEICCSVT